MTSKEALIYLLNMARNPRCSMIVNESGKYTKEELLNIVNQDLDKLEELEKVIKLLKDKIEFEDLGEMQSGNIYRGYFNDCLDEEEYELLKEVLEDE